MSEIIIAIICSALGSSGLVILAIKLWMRKQFDKSLRLFQHELDKKKDTLQMELAVYAEQAKLKVTNHREKTIKALESIYAVFLQTSLTRQQFRYATDLLKNANTTIHDANSEYFRIFSENFRAFTRAFEAVTTGYTCLEENAIYLDQDLEFEVSNALSNVNFCYQKWYKAFNSAHVHDQTLYKQGSLNNQTRSVNFDQFIEDLMNDWQQIVGHAKSRMKTRVRELLSP